MIFDADAAAPMGLPTGVTGVAIAAVAVGAVLAGAFALLKGYGRDPLERLAGWASARGLEYVAPASEDVVATFVGVVEGTQVEVAVTCVARGFGVDLPSRLTTVTAGSGAGSGAADAAPAGAPVCEVQPATWVMDRDGGKAATPVPSGDALFDERWSVRGDADAVALLVTPEVRTRLLAGDADGLVVELSPTAVTIPMPGVCVDPGELDRRLTLVLALDRVRTT